MNSLQWMQVLVSYALQAALVLAIAWGLDRWVRSPVGKTRIWTSCSLSLLGMLAAGLLLPRLQWFDPCRRLEPQTLLAIAHLEHRLAVGLLAVWALGLSVTLVYRLFQFVRLHRFIQSCRRVPEADADRLGRLAGEKLVAPHGRATVFRIAPEPLGPFCYQLHTPTVFLPESLLRGKDGPLQHVLHHELTHLRTQHPMQLFLQRVVQSLLWFHPLVWMTERRANLAREFVCDDAAAQDAPSTVCYLHTLLRIVQQRAHSQGGTLGIGRSESELRVRARRLACPDRNTERHRDRFAFATVMLAAAVVSQCWLPTNVLGSSHSRWSPWPTWSAAALHLLEIEVRDFETFDPRTRVHELLEDIPDRQA